MLYFALYSQTQSPPITIYDIMKKTRYLYYSNTHTNEPDYHSHNYLPIANTPAIGNAKNIQPPIM